MSWIRNTGFKKPSISTITEPYMFGGVRKYFHVWTYQNHKKLTFMGECWDICVGYRTWPTFLPRMYRREEPAVVTSTLPHRLSWKVKRKTYSRFMDNLIFYCQWKATFRIVCHVTEKPFWLGFSDSLRIWGPVLFWPLNPEYGSVIQDGKKSGSRFRDPG